MEAFLSTPLGVALFVAFDSLAVLAVICITYRWLFKRVFDWLFSTIAILLLAPVWAVLFVRGAIAKKRGEIETVLVSEEYIGKKGKTVRLHEFNRAFFRWNLLARLFDIFLGRLSFIGCKALPLRDCTFLSDSEYERHLAKPGLINPLVTCGSEETDYEEMWERDKKYALSFGFFKDFGIFWVWLLKQIRGEGNAHLGKTREKSYAQYLLDDERITQADYDEAQTL